MITADTLRRKEINFTEVLCSESLAYLNTLLYNTQLVRYEMITAVEMHNRSRDNCLRNSVRRTFVMRNSGEEKTQV